MKEEKLLRLIIENQQNLLKESEKEALNESIKNDSISTDFANSVEKIWGIAGAYQPIDEFDSAEALKNTLSKLGNETSIVKQLPKRNLGFIALRIAASISLLLAALIIYFQLNDISSNLVSFETGQIKSNSIQLVDNSSIVLNKNSSIKYFKSLPKSTRKVLLKGEAFFDVSKNAALPFVVSTEFLDVEVIGTSFNVRSYDQENTVEVFVN